FFATGCPMTPTRPTRAGLTGISVSFGRLRLVGLDRGDDGLDRDPSIRDQLAAGPPRSGREWRRPEVLPDEDAGGAAGVHGSGEVDDVLLRQQLRQLSLHGL